MTELIFFPPCLSACLHVLFKDLSWPQETLQILIHDPALVTSMAKGMNSAELTWKCTGLMKKFLGTSQKFCKILQNFLRISQKFLGILQKYISFFLFNLQLFFFFHPYGKMVSCGGFNKNLLLYPIVN